MRSLFISLSILLLLVPADTYAQDKTLQISTKYFDIIYPPLSAETASLLAEHADGMADEICALLETDMAMRLPVYLEPAMEDLNAMFSPFPYNRIVLYDTVASDGSISVFRDGILMVFYHELTHAVSMNIRTPFWQYVSGILGDVVSPATAFTMPLSFLEGATVSFESSDGEGRMNDPLAIQYLLQDKLEGKFMSWKKSSGALDVHPSAKSAYLYGGAFSRWLQQTYGMEKYAELWRVSGGFNLFRSHLEGRFRQTYRISLAEAWQRFADSLVVPPIDPETPERTEGTRDGVISALASGPDGLAWLDVNENAVLFRSTTGRTVSLFDADADLERLSFSPDGRFLLVSGTVKDGAFKVQRLRVFDMADRRFLGEAYPSVRDAAFAGNSRDIVGVETIAQRSSLVLFSRTDQNRKEQAVKKILAVAGPGESSYAIYNPVWAGAGKIAYIAANGLDRSILLVDAASLQTSAVELPSSMKTVRYLQSTVVDGSPVLSFSWAAPTLFYRYAMYRPDSGILISQETDYSGAVFNPVPDAVLPVLHYKAAFSGRDSLRTLDLSKTAASQAVFLKPESANSQSSSKPFPSFTPDASLYNPLPWLLDGTFFPWASMRYDNAFAPGFVYSTGDPAEKIAITVQPSFDSNPFFMDALLSIQWKPRYAQCSASFADLIKAGFGPAGAYRSTAVSLGASLTKHLGPTWKSLSIAQVVTPSWTAPDAELFETPYFAPYRSANLSSDTMISFSARKTGRIPKFPVFAVKTSGVSAAANSYLLFAFHNKELYPAVQAELRLQTPFMPLDLRFSGSVSQGIAFGITDAGPAKESAQNPDIGITRYLPSMPEYAKTSFGNRTSTAAAGLEAEIVPMTLEIQKELPAVPLYSNRIILAGGYRGLYFDEKASSRTYIDSLYVRGTVQGTLVYGALSSVVLSGSYTYAWPLKEGNGVGYISLASSFSF